MQNYTVYVRRYCETTAYWTYEFEHRVNPIAQNNEKIKLGNLG